MTSPGGFRLRKNRPIPGELRRIAIEQADAALERLHAGDVHQTRRRLKQLRALLDLAPRNDELAAVQSHLLRQAAHTLSEARDLEVCRATLDKMEMEIKQTPDASGRHPGPAIFRKARAAVDSTGKSSPPYSSPCLPAIRRLEAARHALAAWVPEAGKKTVRRALRRSYRRTRRAYNEACACLPAEAEPLHRLRKRLKRLWAQLRLLRDFHSRSAKEMIRKADNLGDLLGSEHDLAILQTRLQHGGANTGKLLAEPIAVRRRELQHRALSKAKKFLKKKPFTSSSKLF